MSHQPTSEGPGTSRQATTPGQETSATELEALAAEVGGVLPLRPGHQQLLLDRTQSAPEDVAVARPL